MAADEPPTSIAGLRHGQLSYLQIPAADAEAAARFYASVLGWATDAGGFEAPALIGQWTTERSPAADGGPLGWWHVSDLDAALAAALAAGGTVHDGPVPDGPRRLAGVLDPAGNLVGLVAHGPGGHVDNRTMPPVAVIPELGYDDVAAAIDWLSGAFGFVERWRVGSHRAQMAVGCGLGAIVLAELATADVSDAPQSVMVRVADADAHHERAAGFGAEVVSAPRDHAYGERQYAVRDPGGHEWTFTQSIADIAPEDWGAASGPGLHR